MGLLILRSRVQVPHRAEAFCPSEALVKDHYQYQRFSCSGSLLFTDLQCFNRDTTREAAQQPTTREITTVYVEIKQNWERARKRKEKKRRKWCKLNSDLNNISIVDRVEVKNLSHSVELEPTTLWLRVSCPTDWACHALNWGRPWRTCLLTTTRHSNHYTLKRTKNQEDWSNHLRPANKLPNDAVNTHRTYSLLIGIYWYGIGIIELKVIRLYSKPLNN